MSPPIQLISTDFDGTLFSEFESPPIPREVETQLAGLQNQGVKWVINTGRDMSSLLESLARARVSIQPDYLVLVEREIYEHDGNCYVGLAEWNSACARDHANLFARIRPDVPKLNDWVSRHFHATVYADAYSPFCLIAGNNGDADRIHQYLEEFCNGIPDLVVVRNDVYARFSHASYNKGTALGHLRRRLNLLPENTLAAGDHLNDLPMLTRDQAQWLIAPANAVDSVKQAVLREGGYVSSLPRGQGVADGLNQVLAKASQQKLF